MENPAVENELLELERRYWQAIKERDIDAAMRLTDDPCIVTGAQGVSAINREAMVKMMETTAYSLDDFKLGDDAKVRLLGDDVAIVAYKVHEDLTVEGQPVSFDAAETSTWIRREGGWVCAMHTESLSGDPFGRDRRAAR